MKPRSAKQSENAIQRDIVTHLQWVLPKSYRVIAIPNAARRTASGKASNGVPGLTKGYPDLQIVGPMGRVYTIEVKSEKGRLRKEQEEWRMWCTAHGIPWCLARSVDDVKTALMHWQVRTREVV